MTLLSFAKKYTGQNQQKKSGSAAQSKAAKHDQAKDIKAGVDITSIVDIQPLVTEKGVFLQQNGYVTFRVPLRSSKHQIAIAVAQKYKTKVLAIKTLSVGSKKRRRGITTGRTSAWKKAYVKVDDVQKISVGP